MEFSFLLGLLLITFFLGVILFILSFLLVPKLLDNEKVSSYESGFSPFSNTRNVFEVSFYLVALLFLIFDLEVGLLFPFSVVVGNLPILSFIVAFSFFLILTVGLIYELLNQALIMLISAGKDNI
jgi:NADH-quinone oxidoreductase subunit A